MKLKFYFIFVKETTSNMYTLNTFCTQLNSSTATELLHISEIEKYTCEHADEVLFQCTIW